MVAVAQGPASTALKTWAQRLCGELFPLQQAYEPAVILNQAEDRSKLEQLVGANSGVFADLQTGLAIVGPLIASAVAAFLPYRPFGRRACRGVGWAARRGPISLLWCYGPFPNK